MFVKKLFMCLTAMLSLSAFGTVLQANNGADSIRLYEDACHLDLAPFNVPEFIRPQFKRADAIINKQMFQACYLIREDKVVVFFDDGDAALIPLEVFKNKEI